MMTLSGISGVGAISDVAKISVTTTAVSHTVTQNKHTVIFQNQGTTSCFFGGSTVDPSANRGYELTPKASFFFENTTNDFKVWFRTASGTTTVGVVECD